jgi:subtilisin family serine protease
LTDDKDNDIKVVKSFNSDVFTGASVETETYNIDSLQQLPGVKRVWRNHFIPLTVPTPDFLPDDVAARNYTSHNTTGVSKLHARGYFGKGVKIGVVDTGTAWDHPAVGSLLHLTMRNIWSAFY